MKDDLYHYQCAATRQINDLTHAETHHWSEICDSINWLYPLSYYRGHARGNDDDDDDDDDVLVQRLHYQKYVLLRCEYVEQYYGAAPKCMHLTNRKQ